MARLRAECVRTGVREVTVTKGSAASGGFGPPKFVARISPLRLPTSKTIRLNRLYKGSVYKEELGQLQLPVRNAKESASTVISAPLMRATPERKLPASRS